MDIEIIGHTVNWSVENNVGTRTIHNGHDATVKDAFDQSIKGNIWDDFPSLD